MLPPEMQASIAISLSRPAALALCACCSPVKDPSGSRWRADLGKKALRELDPREGFIAELKIE